MVRDSVSVVVNNNFCRPDGWKYEGAFSNDKKHGPGMMTTPDGDIMKGVWSEDERLRWL